MLQKRVLPFLSVIFLFLATAAESQLSVTSNFDSIGKYEVAEFNIVHPHSYANNWEHVNVQATFINHDTVRVSGFFYDTNIWKLRFAPGRIGTWTYVITFNTAATSYTFSGNFTCVESANKGHLQLHPGNPYRLIYSDGSLFNGIGIGDCILDFDGDGSALNDWGFDGENRSANYHGSATSLMNYMHAYGTDGAGFNLFRWSTDNCSFKLFDSIKPGENSYNIQSGKWGDSLVLQGKKNKLSIWLTLFNGPLFKTMNGNTPDEEFALKKYLDYIVSRYGAFVDIWELFNENSATDYWINFVSGYVKSIDPYKNLISVSDPRPDLKVIEITSPHWYEKEPEDKSDLRTWEMIGTYRKWKKPIIFGEQGNAIQNWDPLSAQRMRVRSWTVFFAEGIFIFWNTSAVKDYQHLISANIYLGPQERGYIKALQKFTSIADSSIRQFPLSTTNPGEVRSYGLRSEKLILGYFFNYSSHTSALRASFDYRMRRGGTIEWINPSDNVILQSSRLKEGKQTIVSPDFNVDIAMRITLDSVAAPLDLNGKLSIVTYPNPAENSFTIEGNFDTLKSFELLDGAGKTALLCTSIHNEQMINVTSLRKGVYFFRAVSSEGRACSGKILIQ